MTEFDQNRAAEDLQYIRRIMQDSRRITAERGDGFILWGIIVLLGFLGSAADAFGWWEVSAGYTWTVLVVLGWVWMFIHTRRFDVSVMVNPLAKKMLDSLWTAVLIAMTLLGFLGTLTGVVDGNNLSGVLFIVLGIGYFIQGSLMDRTWVRMLGVGWWIGGVTTFYTGIRLDFILSVAMMIGLQIVPGIIFYRTWKRHIAALTDD